MNDLIPKMVDGAIVLDLQNGCPGPASHCEDCTHLVLNVHNWIRYAELEYVVIDLQDEKYICPTFLEELMLLRKRLRGPFLFAGVTERPQQVLTRCSYGHSYPTFVSPEDAVRALRIQYPGLTEAPLHGEIQIGFPLLVAWKTFQGEILGATP